MPPLAAPRYDPAGNRLLRDGQTNLAQCDALHRFLENDEFFYSYDPNGNLTSKEAKVGGATQAQVIRKILRHLKLSADPTPVAPTRVPQGTVAWASR